VEEKMAQASGRRAETGFSGLYIPETAKIARKVCLLDAYEAARAPS